LNRLWYVVKADCTALWLSSWR